MQLNQKQSPKSSHKTKNIVELKKIALVTEILNYFSLVYHKKKQFLLFYLFFYNK